MVKTHKNEGFLEEIKYLILGSFFKNEDFLLSFFNQIKDEHNIQLFLLDYQGKIYNKSLISEIENLIDVMIDVEYISFLRKKDNLKKYIICDSDITFVFDSEKKRKKMKEKKLLDEASTEPLLFSRIELMIDEELGEEKSSIMKHFFRHLSENNQITDFDKFEKEFRPNGMKRLIDDVDVMDFMLTLLIQGIVSESDRKNGKMKLRIKNSKIYFTINEVGDIKTTKHNKKEKPKKPKMVEKEFSMTEEEINERALSVINSALKNSTEEVINIFEQISLPFNGANYKRQLFEKIFEFAEIDGEWRDDVGYVIFSKKRTEKTVVSHMDLISPFNRGFSKGRVYEIEDGKLIGALDNTFTNAVVINSILNNKSDNTTYLFTLDEETTQYAIRDYMKLFGTEQFIINLDITNEGMKNKNCMAIEYDEPSWEICNQINKNMENPFFTKDRVCDDMDEVIKADGYGFSYCIPSAKSIHSYNNFTYLNNIKPYMDGLDYLLHELCLDCYEPNIKHIGIGKALKCNSLKKLVKKDVRKVQKTRKYTETHSSSSRRHYDNGGRIQTRMRFEEEYPTDDETENPWISDNNLNQDFSEVTMVMIEDLIPSEYYEFKDFLEHKLLEDNTFTKGEIIDASNEKVFSYLKAMDFIGIVDSNQYVFNKDYVNDSKFNIIKKAITEAPNLDIIKFAKFLASIEDEFSMFDLVRLHINKDLDENKKMGDFISFLNALITYGYAENKEGKFFIL